MTQQPGNRGGGRAGPDGRRGRRTCRGEDGKQNGEIEPQLFEELRESRRRLSTLMSNLPGMAYRCLNDAHWTMLFVSDGARELCGHSAGALVSDEVRWEQLIFPDDREHVRRKVQEAVDEGRRFTAEYRIRHAGGSVCWVWEQGCGVFEDGELVALEGFITDVTARKHAEEELRTADRRKDQFMAMLGHELRNPLTAITSVSELLNRLEHDSPAFERIKGVLSRQSRQMTRLIDGLLDVSRITRGKIELAKTAVDLAGLLGDLVEDRAEHLSRRNFEMDVDAEESELWVKADPVRLSQVFDNLLINAVNFTDPSETISLGARAEGEQAVVTVRDTGAGIDEELLPHVFEPFQQAPQDLARSQGGLGLGLALAQGLVELHDGQIEARSDGLGEGTEFVVRLPLVEPTREDGADKSPTSTERCQVLLIEDDPDVADAITLMLDRVGHDATVAHNGREGLDAAARRRPDVVLCDLGLPGMSGYDFVRTVRADDDLAALPTVALSGYGGEDVRRRALDAGFDAHVTKPVGLDELAKVCAKMVDVRS